MPLRKFRDDVAKLVYFVTKKIIRDEAIWINNHVCSHVHVCCPHGWMRARACMHVCAYDRMKIYRYVVYVVYVCMQCIYVCMYVCMYLCIYVCMYVCMYVCTCVCASCACAYALNMYAAVEICMCNTYAGFSFWMSVCTHADICSCCVMYHHVRSFM